MAAKRSVFLDVDSNILEKNLLLEEYKSDVDDYKTLLGLKSQDDGPWKLATPEPGFCVKTTDSKGKKVFVNFCTLNDIPEPKDITEEELLSHINAENASDFRVPLSLQAPHEETDKSGNPAVCYDVAVNPKFYNKVETSAGFRLFLLQVTFDGLQEKYEVELDVDGHVILKNRKCVGTLRPHRIRTAAAPLMPKKPLVEEVLKPVSAVPAYTKSPGYRFYSANLDDQNLLYGEVHLPKVVTGSEISLEIGEDRIIVDCRRSLDLLDVFFALKLDQNSVTSEFSKATRILHICVPIV